MTSVLLLNASYQPMGVISWQRAVTMVFAGKVEIVEEYEHDIRSVSIAIKAPSIVRLLRFIRIPRRNPPLKRTNVLARDNFECQYCEKKLRLEEATLDHVIPRSQGGITSWENVVCCCKRCNRKKGGRTPKEARMRLKTKPVRPDWLPVINFRLHGNVPLCWKDFIRNW